MYAAELTRHDPPPATAPAFDLAVRIGEVKEYAELPVVELGREQQVLQRVEKLRSEPLDSESAHQIFTSIMLAMRRLQSRHRGDEAPPPVQKKKPAKKRR